jgi:hypothetical protein
MVENSAIFETGCKVRLAPCWWLFSVSFQELLAVILQPTALSSPSSSSSSSSSLSSSQTVLQTCQIQKLSSSTEIIPSYQISSVYLINTRKYLIE